SERNVDMWEEAYKQRLGNWLDRWTQLTIGNSRAVGDYLAAKGLPREKIRVIDNGVDTSRFDEPVDPGPVRAELGIAPRHLGVRPLARPGAAKGPAHVHAGGRDHRAAAADGFLSRRRGRKLAGGPRTRGARAGPTQADDLHGPTP